MGPVQGNCIRAEEGVEVRSGGGNGLLHSHLRKHAFRSEGAAPEVQVSHASVACLALAGTEDNLSPLLNASHKLLPLGLHPFLQQHILTDLCSATTAGAHGKDSSNHAVTLYR